MAKPGFQTSPLKERLPRDKFIELYEQQGISQKDLATMYDVSVAYVIRLRKQYGIARNPHSHRDPPRAPKDRVSLESQTTIEEMTRLYNTESMSCADIAKRFGVSRKTVWKYLRRHGLAVRTKTQARRTAIAQGKIKQVLYDINEDFFDTWSPSMAWILGLMVTDGHIAVGPSGSLVPSLSSVSLPLLERVRTAMGSNHPIKLKKQTLGGTIFRFDFCRRKMAERLVSFGITPKKSLKVPFPLIPRPYLSHFIRGVFDGDGSVFMDPRIPKSGIRVFFVSGSRDFISGLEGVLHREAGLREQTIYHRPTGTSFYFKYGHSDALRFFDFVYAGATDTIRFEEKYQKFLECMRLAGISEGAIAMRSLTAQTCRLPPERRVRN